MFASRKVGNEVLVWFEVASKATQVPDASVKVSSCSTTVSTMNKRRKRPRADADRLRRDISDKRAKTTEHHGTDGSCAPQKHQANKAASNNQILPPVVRRSSPKISSSSHKRLSSSPMNVSQVEKPFSQSQSSQARNVSHSDHVGSPAQITEIKSRDQNTSISSHSTPHIHTNAGRSSDDLETTCTIPGHSKNVESTGGAHGDVELSRVSRSSDFSPLATQAGAVPVNSRRKQKQIPTSKSLAVHDHDPTSPDSSRKKLYKQSNLSLSESSDVSASADSKCIQTVAVASKSSQRGVLPQFDDTNAQRSEMSEYIRSSPLKRNTIGMDRPISVSSSTVHAVSKLGTEFPSRGNPRVSRKPEAIHKPLHIDVFKCQAVPHEQIIPSNSDEEKDNPLQPFEETDASSSDSGDLDYVESEVDSEYAPYDGKEEEDEEEEEEEGNSRMLNDSSLTNHITTFFGGDWTTVEKTPLSDQNCVDLIVVSFWTMLFACRCASV